MEQQDKDTLVDLLQSANHGDGQAFEGFVERLEPLFLNYLKNCKDIPAVDRADLVQETFLALVKQEWKQIIDPYAWCFKVLKCKVIDFRRRGGKGETRLISTEELANLVEKSETPQEIAESQEMQDKIACLLSILSDSERAVAQQRIYGKGSVSELCEKLGIGRSQYYVILNKIKEKIGPYLGLSNTREE